MFFFKKNNLSKTVFLYSNILVRQTWVLSIFLILSITYAHALHNVNQ